jgi:hypothetical protein
MILSIRPRPVPAAPTVSDSSCRPARSCSLSADTAACTSSDSADDLSAARPDAFGAGGGSPAATGASVIPPPGPNASRAMPMTAPDVCTNVSMVIGF